MIETSSHDHDASAPGSSRSSCRAVWPRVVHCPYIYELQPERTPNFSMPELTVVRNFNTSWSPSYTPVAVFVGGTSGIGEAMVKALAHYTSGRVHLIIVGRNRSAAEKTFASISNTTEGPSLREFIYCDATLMTNIEVLAKQISGVVSKINFLVLSLGYFQVWTGRNETEEGIDRLLSLRYYSRFKIIHELLPLLHKAQVTGEDAKVMAILGAALGMPVNFDDLGVKKSWWGGYRAGLASAPYNDIMVEVSLLREAITSNNDFRNRNMPNAIQASYLRTYGPVLSIPPESTVIISGSCACSHLWWTSSSGGSRLPLKSVQSTCSSPCLREKKVSISETTKETRIKSHPSGTLFPTNKGRPSGITQ